MAGDALVAVELRQLANQLLDVRGEPSRITLLKFGSSPIVAVEASPAIRRPARAVKRDERVGVAHRVVKRDAFARLDSAHRHQRGRVEKAAVRLARMIDEVHGAEVVIVREKCFEANLQ